MSVTQDQLPTSTKRAPLLFNYSLTNNPAFTPEIQKIMPRQSDIFQVTNLFVPSTWKVPEPLVPWMNNDTEKPYTQPSLKENLCVEVESYDEVPSDISDWVIEHMNETDLQQLVESNVVPEIMKEQSDTTDDDNLGTLLELNVVTNNQQQNLDLFEYLACSTPSSDHLVGQELNSHVQTVPGSMTSNQIPVMSDLYEPVTPVLSPGNHTEHQNHIHLTELEPMKSVSSENQILSALNLPRPLSNLIIPSTVEEKFISLPLEEVKDSFNIQTQKPQSQKQPKKKCELDLQETNANTSEFDEPVMDFVLNSPSAFIDDDSNSTSSSKNDYWESTSNKRERWSIRGKSFNGKREKNNYSSKRSRAKKAQIEKENEEKCNQLDIENRRLKIKSMKLKERIDELYKHQSNLLLQAREILREKF